MNIYNLMNKLKHEAIKHKMVNMASFGEIGLYNDKATIAYPYVNFDVVNSSTTNFIKKYTIRIYICDRNEPYIAYNKTETILDDILKQLEIEKYFVNYFTLEFADVVNGVFCDFEIETALSGDCNYETLFDSYLTEDGGYILQENGDLINLQ